AEREVGDVEMAMLALRSALRENYGYEPVVAELERLASATNAWSSLLPELMNEAKALADEDPRSAADLWVRVANWYAEPLRRPDYAIAAAKAAIDLVPHHVDALASLSSFLRAQGEWSRMVEVSTRLAAVEPDPE